MKLIEDLECKLNYKFHSPELLSQALTHSSHANEQEFEPFQDNERMEFLGDAVLGFLISDFLFQARPNLSEGQLSKLKGFLVSSVNLVKYAEQLQLGDYLYLGKGEEKTGGREKQALLVNAFEAIVAAIYLDGGIGAIRKIVLTFFSRQIEEVSVTSESVTDFKTTLQEELQARGLGVADYATVSEEGPDHQKLYTIAVSINNEHVASGKGLTKKAAEQAAAMDAIQFLREGSVKE